MQITGREELFRDMKLGRESVDLINKEDLAH